jgi:hypothetical protein
MSLDDFRAYSRALTREEVHALYRLGARRAEILNDPQAGGLPPPGGARP